MGPLHVLKNTILEVETPEIKFIHGSARKVLGKISEKPGLWSLEVSI